MAKDLYNGYMTSHIIIGLFIELHYMYFVWLLFFCIFYQDSISDEPHFETKSVYKWLVVLLFDSFLLIKLNYIFFVSSFSPLTCPVQPTQYCNIMFVHIWIKWKQWACRDWEKCIKIKWIEFDICRAHTKNSDCQ